MGLQGMAKYGRTRGFSRFRSSGASAAKRLLVPHPIVFHLNILNLNLHGSFWIVGISNCTLLLKEKVVHRTALHSSFGENKLATS